MEKISIAHLAFKDMSEYNRERGIKPYDAETGDVFYVTERQVRTKTTTFLNWELGLRTINMNVHNMSRKKT